MAVIVVYGGGFQPFHAGHLSSYEEAKEAFPNADFYVAASNDTKTRPIPFDDKKFLAQQAGVTDPFVQVVAPINPKEILDRYSPKKDIFILVRSERDPVGYTKKDGTPGYYQPFTNLDKCQPFGYNGYVFVTHKKEFKLNGQDVYSGTQVRDMYTSSDDAGRQSIVQQLYPNSQKQDIIKQMLDKYIGTASEPIEKPVTGAIKKLKANKLKEQIERIRPLIKEASPEKKLKLLKLMKEALKANEGVVKEITKQAAVQQYKDIQDYKHVDKKPTKPKPEDEKEFLRISISRPKKQPAMAEAFDKPYSLKWEKSEYGDIDALAKLPDGSPLSIMFNLADMSENDWGVEFYRNNSQEVTGEGDAYRVFATVLTAIRQFIKKKKPDTIFFTAVKEDDPTGSREKLYDKLVQRYSTGLGYNLEKVEYPQQTGYKLIRKEQSMAEGSEWETRHDEFTTVGDRATPEQINKIVSALGVAAKQASSKRGFLNQIAGKQSNGDLARMAHGAETLAKNIQRNRNSKPGSDDRKELGQHLVYAVSLLKRMNGEQGVAEGNITESTDYLEEK